MPFAPLRKGTLFLVGDTAAGDKKRHLFALLNDPYGPQNQVLMASFSTQSPDYFCDDTCLVQGAKQEHDFIVVGSFVRYQYLKLMRAEQLANGVATKVMAPTYPLSQALFDRICAGVHASPFAAPQLKTFLREAHAAGY